MKIFSIIFLGLALGYVIPEDDDLLVVSPFKLEEISCPALQCLRRSIQPYPVEEGAILRDKVCRTIAGSAFFRDTHHIIPLKPEQSRIYSKTSLIEVPANITDDYRPRKVCTYGNLSYETVFPCMTWDYNAGNFVEIFISRQFELSFLGNQSPSNPFRLVFKEDGVGILFTIAIAEKGAEVKYLLNNEREHLSQQKLSESNTSSICHLTASQKLRLCTIILNAPKYRDEIAFPVNANDEEPQCKRQNVTLSYGTYREHEYTNVEEIVTVWAVECQAIKTQDRIGFSSSPDYFYIFRADFKAHLNYIARKRDFRIEVEGECDL